MKKIVSVILLLFVLSSTTAVASDSQETKGNWETAIYLDNYKIITRVALDKDNEIAVKLREFSEALGYSVEWNKNGRFIILQNENVKIKIVAGKYTCEKNGEKINVDKPVYIDHGYAYLPQSFLRTIFDIDTVAIDQEAGTPRVNGVFLANKMKNDLIIVNSDAFHLEAIPNDAAKKGEALLFSFALGTEKEDISMSMDYEMFLKTNETKIAEIVKGQIEKINGHDLNHPDKMAAFKISTVNEINKALNIQFVKYIYVTDFTWYSPS